jgi:hypothetical protein
MKCPRCASAVAFVRDKNGAIHLMHGEPIDLWLAGEDVQVPSDRMILEAGRLNLCAAKRVNDE